MLKITRLTLRNFRSYESFELNNLGDLVIFVGPNASGKTNAVEAIHLMAAQSSFRRAKSSELVRQSVSDSRVSTLFEGDGRSLELEMQIADGKRTWKINGKPRPAKDMRGLLASVAFTPDDLQLVKGAPKLRRRELDQLGAQLNANYQQIIRDYDKLLRQKNSLLREAARQADRQPIRQADRQPTHGFTSDNEYSNENTNVSSSALISPNADVIAAVNDVMAIVGKQLSNYRRALFDRLIPRVAKHYEELANEPLAQTNERESFDAKYISSWQGELVDALTETLPEEIARHRTLVGPHLDEVNFEIDGLDAITFASQGQQRSIVLALKLAEVDLIEEMLGQPPILILDDVMSELDAKRRSALISALQRSAQTFVTTANLDYFDDEMLTGARIVRL